MGEGAPSILQPITPERMAALDQSLDEAVHRVGDLIRQRMLELQAAETQNELLADALERLIKIIQAAGLENLSKGVQLGPTAWYVKASDALEQARAALQAAKQGEKSQ